MGVIVIRHRARHTHQHLNRIERVTKDDFNTLPLPIVWPLYFAFKATLRSSQSNSSQGCGSEVAFVSDSRFFAICNLRLVRLLWSACRTAKAALLTHHQRSLEPVDSHAARSRSRTAAKTRMATCPN